MKSAVTDCGGSPSGPHPPSTACLGLSSSTSQLASALAFISRSTSAYTFVVVSDTCPSHARIVLMSTPGAQQVRRRRVANRVRTDPLGGQRRHLLRRPSGTAFHQRMDAEPRDRSAAPIQEHVLARVTALHQRRQFADRLGPQRAPAGLVPLAPDQDRGQVAVGHLRQGQVLDPDLGRFIGPSAGVVQEQQQGMVPTALGRRQVRRRQHAHPSPPSPGT